LVILSVGYDTTSEKVVEAVLEAESVTWILGENVPATVGVPEIVPELESVTPVGKVPPARDQVYPVPLPPMELSVAE
jgi:hypothetical protein